jgi:hypothetical protein
VKKFLAIYLGSTSSLQRQKWQALEAGKREELQAAAMKAWFEWGTTHQKSIVEVGGPLGKTKRADTAGVSDVRNNMTGYVIVRAESHEAAAKLFENHPHFSLLPGEAVEIMECLPIPGQ